MRSAANSTRMLFTVLMALAVDSVAAAATSTSSFSVQCSTLSVLLPTKVAQPGSGAYTSSLESYFWQQEQDMQPDCIVTPTSNTDVQVAVGALTGVYALDAWAANPVAVRSGGHGVVVGASNDNYGVAIDLSSLNTITLSVDKKVVSLGAGVRWQDVYAALDPYNLTVSGARVAGLGVGGFLTGGGISFFSAARGWACDAIVSVEVVLAGGATINASKTSYPDLFAALQGGSNNFGIVTRFDLQTFAQGEMLGGLIVYPISTLAQQQEAFMTYMAPANFDPNAALIQAFVFSATEGVLVSNDIEYSQPVLNPPAIQPFTSIEPQYESTERIGTLLDFVNEQATFQPTNARGLYATTVFTPKLAVLETIFSLWNATLPAVEAVAGLEYSLIFQRIPTTVPGSVNSLGLPANANTLALCQLSLSWNNASDDALITGSVESLMAAIEKATKAAGVFNEFKYINYAASFQDPLDGYGAANKAKLLAASKKYDPLGFFQKGVPGGFKLQ